MFPLKYAIKDALKLPEEKMFLDKEISISG